MTTCGFQMLFDFITSMSPQLGGKYRDLQQYVDMLVISEGEPISVRVLSQSTKNVTRNQDTKR